MEIHNPFQITSNNSKGQGKRVGLPISAPEKGEFSGVRVTFYQEQVVGLDLLEVTGEN